MERTSQRLLTLESRLVLGPHSPKGVTFSTLLLRESASRKSPGIHTVADLQQQGSTGASCRSATLICAFAVKSPGCPAKMVPSQPSLILRMASYSPWPVAGGMSLQLC